MTENATPRDTSTANTLTAELIAAILAVPSSTLTASSKLFLINILNGNEGNRRSIHRLARDLGNNYGTVILSTRDLERQGVLTVERDADAPKTKIASRYRVNVARIRELANPPKIERVWPYEAPVNGEVPDSHYPHLGV